MPTYMLIVYINSLTPLGEMQHNKIAYNKQLVKEVPITSLISHLVLYILSFCMSVEPLDREGCQGKFNKILDANHLDF